VRWIAGSRVVTMFVNVPYAVACIAREQNAVWSMPLCRVLWFLLNKLFLRCVEHAPLLGTVVFFKINSFLLSQKKPVSGLPSGARLHPHSCGRGPHTCQGQAPHRFWGDVAERARGRDGALRPQTLRLARACWTLSLRKRKEAKEKGLSEPDSLWS
jgi:hypothetical protein